ncbi:MAG: Gfo/Idh/MocA family oxidoreductase [Clostridia bacterium]|nr:Gfo/Idh/MocA family oxidoreductase [Clostridia bacterium]
MYKVAILGCENSHANIFLKLVLEEKLVEDMEFVGVYSDEIEAAQKLNEQFGVPVMQTPDELVGKVDGVIITARHGANHYKYAKPYIESGIPMFIDKPVTVDEEEAVTFMKELKANGVRVSGGSCLGFANYIQELKQAVKEETYGKVLGGHMRAALDMNNPYGGFFFYSQHLVQMMGEVFGYFPDSVQMFSREKRYTCVVRYADFDVTAEYAVGCYNYYAGISCEKEFVGSMFDLRDCFAKEFMAYYNLLRGGEQEQSYEEFIAPVFVLNAMHRSMESGKEEKINRAGEI